MKECDLCELNKILILRMKAIIFDTNLTAKEISRRIGVSLDSVNRITEKEKCGMHVFKLFCIGLHVNPGFLFGMTDDPSPYVVKNRNLFYKQCNICHDKADSNFVNDYWISLNSQNHVEIVNLIFDIEQNDSFPVKYQKILNWCTEKYSDIDK